jgi:hypothetical protein
LNTFPKSYKHYIQGVMGKITLPMLEELTRKLFDEERVRENSRI